MENKLKFTRCLRCHRLLRNEKAKQRGYGSVCWVLHNKEVDSKNRLFPIKSEE